MSERKGSYWKDRCGRIEDDYRAAARNYWKLQARIDRALELLDVAIDRHGLRLDQYSKYLRSQCKDIRAALTGEGE